MGRIVEERFANNTEVAYDHFGRLAQKDENGLVYAYAYDAYGNRTSRTVSSANGETTEERRSYDKYGRLVEISSFGSSVKYRYDTKGRIARQVVDGTPIDFTYTKYGRLAGKYLGGMLKPEASVEYEYSKSGQIVARTANGVRQTYEYDGRGQLLAVKENGADVERYVYDKAGNMVKKTLLRRGRAVSTKPPTSADYVVTTYAFDGANQLVSSTTDGVTTRYAYDAAGRLVREGDRTYRYGYLDKVLSVTEGDRTYTYDYHVDGQLARAVYGNVGGNDGRARTPAAPPAASEDFLWDGLALIKRGDERFVNEPHVGGGNPIASSKGTTYFNDILGTTVGAKQNRKYSAAALTAFGESDPASQPLNTSTSQQFFTGKPEVAGLGHAFLFRNYRASLGKWQTSDPLGYPDGWNQMAYCNNDVTGSVDLWGCVRITICSDSKGGASSFNESGHSWIIVEKDNGQTTTYGTWGNNPIGTGNGLFENLEDGRNVSASRSANISDAQYQSLMDFINDMKDMGDSAWSATDPCSDFALDAWEIATGEDLNSWWIWDTPSDVTESIINANGGKKHGVLE